jgi:hypothetical protein
MSYFVFGSFAFLIGVQIGWFYTAYIYRNHTHIEQDNTFIWIFLFTNLYCMLLIFFKEESLQSLKSEL